MGCGRHHSKEKERITLVELLVVDQHHRHVVGLLLPAINNAAKAVVAPVLQKQHAARLDRSHQLRKCAEHVPAI